MTGTDLTLVVIAHDETFVCGPMMRSADLAVEAARAAGITVQAVVALHRPTAATVAYFQQPAYDHWERWLLEEGDPARLRNALVPRTDGSYLAFLGPDHLISENCLLEGVTLLKAAADRGERVIAHPEVTLHFDGEKSVQHNLDSDSLLFTPHLLYVHNCFDALCLAPREAHLEVPYAPGDMPPATSSPDWQFAVETISRGWRHVLVPDTVIFRRRRDGSVTPESTRRRSLIRALPEMAIDRIRGLAAAPAAPGHGSPGPSIER